MKKHLPNYEFCVRCTKAGKSGIAVAVKQQTFNSVLDVTNTILKDILSVRIGMTNCAVRVILGYAPQETEPSEIREAFFEELEIETNRCKMDGDFPLVIGDLNAKITTENQVITSTSPNGKLLLKIIENQDLNVLNFDEKCDGKWTHVIRTTGASSVLDYAMTSESLTQCIKGITIDEMCLFCPFSLKRKRGQQTPQYSDHNAIIISLEINHSRKLKEETMNWKISKSGLEKFHNLTSCQDLPTETSGRTCKEVYDNYTRTLLTTMDKCFKKKKTNSPPPITNKDQYTLYKQVRCFAKRGKAQRQVARKYTQEMIKANQLTVAQNQKEAVQLALKNLTVNNNFSVDRFWKLCKKSRVKGRESGASVVTEDGRELFSAELILDAYKNEFKHRLRQREISPDLKNFEDRSKQLCALILKTAEARETPDFSPDEYQKVRAKLKRNKSTGRDTIPAEVVIDSGVKLDQLTLNVMNYIKNAKTNPLQWEDVLITTLYKNKGLMKLLVNYRGIFLKQILSKIYEKMIINRTEDNIKNVDKSQAGARSNRSTADQTFLLRGSIDHCKYLNKVLYIVLYDFTQCFDSLWLEDCIISLWNIGIQDETLSSIMSFNKNCNIVVKTPVGRTEEFHVPMIVQQGSVSGGILCSVSTAEVNQENCSGGVQIGPLNIRNLTYMDDIAAGNTIVRKTYSSHQQVLWFADKKRMGLNGPKCVILPVNKKPYDIVPRLKIGETILEEKQSAPYLGDIFNSKGNNDDMVEDRINKGRGCTIKSISLCEDVTMGWFTFETLLLVYRGLFLAVVLYNAQAWSNLSQDNIKALQVVQLKFFKRMFHAPSTTCNVLIFLDTATIPIENEIHIRKLNFLHHVLTLENDDPVKRLYQVQISFTCAPNWGNEVLNLRKMYSFSETDSEIAKMSKEKWKKMTRSKITQYVFNTLKLKSNSLKHIQKLETHNTFERQEYLTKLSPTHARKIFQIRAGIIDFKAVRKYVYGDDKKCRLCKEHDESTEHVVNECVKIEREEWEDDINVYSSNIKDQRGVAQRCVLFEKMVESLG